MRKLLILLLTTSLFLFACSDDDSDANDTAVATATSAAPTATMESPAPSQSPATDRVVEGTVSVDFTGAPQELEPIEVPFEVEAGSTAWDAIKAALGEDNLAFQDFGGDLGIFINGFNGVQAEGNHFWEFKVNGEGAEVGVGTYEVQQGDVLEFVYSSF